MNSASDVDQFDMRPYPGTTATGPWSAGYEEQHEKSCDLSRMVKIAGFALALAVSPITAIPDPWLLEKRRRDAAITISIYQEVIGRFISRNEALRISRQILEQAEQERLETANFEAARGIHWGD